MVFGAIEKVSSKSVVMSEVGLEYLSVEVATVYMGESGTALCLVSDPAVALGCGAMVCEGVNVAVVGNVCSTVESGADADVEASDGSVCDGKMLSTPVKNGWSTGTAVAVD